jgi:hypothetical protein
MRLCQIALPEKFLDLYAECLLAAKGKRSVKETHSASEAKAHDSELIRQ